MLQKKHGKFWLNKTQIMMQNFMKMKMKCAISISNNGLVQRGYDVYQIVSDKTFARNAATREWLNDKGYVADDILAPPEELIAWR